jgi:hypothetical protein
MLECLNHAKAGLHIVSYLDGYLLEQVEKDGGAITASSMDRMFFMLSRAREDGADVIIMTCTIFSPYAEAFQERLGTPIVCPDGAMLDAAAKAGGKTAILCTFHGTIETTKKEFLKYQRKNCMPESVDMFLAPEAFAAAQRSDLERFDFLIREKIKELDPDYDHVVLAQISMARAAKIAVMKNAKLWTSPDSAAAVAISLLRGREEDS